MNDIKRDVLDVDVLFVGAGPASLAGALHLKKQADKTNGKTQNNIWKTKKTYSSGSLKILRNLSTF